MPQYKSSDILLKLAADDKQAMETLFRSHYEEMCKYAFSILQDQYMAEDIVQEIFLRLWEKRKSLIIKQSFRSYLFSSTHNNCIQLIKHKCVIDRHCKETLQSAGKSSPKCDERLHLSELQKLVSQTLQSLPEQTRYVFHLSRTEGLKYAEIAQKLEISIKTVEAKMGQALKQFRSYLKEYIA